MAELFFGFYALLSLSFNWIFANGLYGGTGYFFLILIGFYAVASSKPYYIDNQIANKTALDILSVEDDRINRLLAVRVLEKMGYQPTTTTNGQEAIAALLQTLLTQQNKKG